MKKLEASDLKNLKLLQHYRIIRRWACKNNNLKDTDLELLIYLDCIDLFTKNDFEKGVYKINVYDGGRVIKGKQLIKRIYRIILGEEDIPTSSKRNKIMKGLSYMDKVLKKSILEVNKDIIKNKNYDS